MSRKRVLLVLHNHPAISPGGSEAYAMEVYRAFQRADDLEPMVLARADPAAMGANVHPYTPFAALEDRNQMLALVPEENYDKFNMRMHEKTWLARSFADLLRSRRPDVVHFQHTLFLGAELISVARQTLPEAAIVFTLHEYLPICNHYGQLVRTSGELCTHDSPRRCHECFPQHSPGDFFLRKSLIQSHFEQVDTFVAPSRFLLEQYVRWGIPRTKIRYEPHGFALTPREPAAERERRDRFAFFGVMTPFKGIDVLLGAMEKLGPGFEGSLRIHGAGYAEQPEEMRTEIERLLEATEATVTDAGPYEHAALPHLMAGADWVVVPSIWWENAPLVIQESFMHGRPVICSDIGGMAEHVQNGVSGLHFRVGDPEALAETMRRAAGDPELWHRLQQGLPAVRSIDDHVGALRSIYDRALEARAQPRNRRAGAPVSH
jgi:glycosyltransferase involved in cell wall biosynthesis